MKVAEILQEFVIFAREKGVEEDEHLLEVVREAERHIDAQMNARERRERLARRPECERCLGPSSSGILCWDCLGAAPSAVRHAFRDATGVEGIRLAAEKVRAWIKASSVAEPRRHAA